MSSIYMCVCVLMWIEDEHYEEYASKMIYTLVKQYSKGIVQNELK